MGRLSGLRYRNSNRYEPHDYYRIKSRTTNYILRITFHDYVIQITFYDYCLTNYVLRITFYVFTFYVFTFCAAGRDYFDAPINLSTSTG